MKHIGLFEGIGGFSLAARWMGWDTIAWCEWNEFGQKVLKYHFPKAIPHGDITKTDFTIYRGQCDILTGGFPCQPYSQAGKRKGTDDERHLWPHMLRAIGEIQPRWVVGENVFGLTNWNGGLVFEQVQLDLENEGYEVQAFVLPACAVNAPHRRDRIWFVAYAEHNGCNGSQNGQSDRKGNDSDQTGKDPALESERCGSEATGEYIKGVEFDRFTIDPLIQSDGEYNSGAGSGKGMDMERDIMAQAGRNEGANDSESSGGNDEDTVHGLETAADTESGGGRGLRDESSETGTRQSNFTLGGIHRISHETYTNTSDTRLQGSEIDRSTGEVWPERDQQFAGLLPSDWQEFPTQSPVCDGNDGISARLDAITFSKWRQESIKGGGNAIVPQVALNIFRAIEEYENIL